MTQQTPEPVKDKLPSVAEAKALLAPVPDALDAALQDGDPTAFTRSVEISVTQVNGQRLVTVETIDVDPRGVALAFLAGIAGQPWHIKFSGKSDNPNVKPGATEIVVVPGPLSVEGYTDDIFG